MLIRLRVPQDVAVARNGTVVKFSGRGIDLEFNAPNELVAADLEDLKGGVSEAALRCAGEIESAAAFFHATERLARHGFIEHAWVKDGREALLMRPLDATFDIRETEPAEDAVLSPDTLLTPEKDGWTLRRAGFAGEAVVLDESLLGPLAGLARDPAGESTGDLKRVLWRYGFVVSRPTDALAHECWELPDLLLHHATRHPGYGHRLGGTYRFRGRFPPPPARKATMSDHFVALPQPVGNANGGRLCEVMTRRQSCRKHDDANPMTQDDLAAFLYRCLRSEVLPHGGEQELLKRPYPAGGSIHELEFYLAVHVCGGLEAGMYHYQGLEHRLYRIAGADTAMPLMKRAAAAWGNPESLPQTLVIGATRLPRLAWKYERIAYRLTLLNAGVALQTMYLVAEDLGLGGCALGAGDSAQFARATGLDPADETSIMEFALGSRAAG